tara:strand:+ start:63 stop:299 length:237 start_codon:yes stop_codon:yes gene_type:complete
MIAFGSNKKPFSIPCKLCGNIYKIFFNEEDFDDWQSGKGYIQELLHYLTAAERELLISGTCDTCWKAMYGEEDLDDDD